MSSVKPMEMETKLEHKDGLQMITNGEMSLPVPERYTLICSYAAKEAEFHHDTLFEVFLAAARY